MSLATLETALLEEVVAALAACPGQPEPDQVLRHHGGAPPDVCCTVGGVLSAWWMPATPDGDCSSPPRWTINLRLARCYPTMDVTGMGVVVPNWTDRDAAAALLADAAQCVTAALTALGCACGNGNPFADIASRIKLDKVEAGRPQGGCASVTWRIVATVRHQPITPT